MTKLKANTGKKLTVVVDGKKYARYAIKTTKITPRDNIENIIEKHVAAHLKPSDIVAVSERVVAITQGRMIPISDINPGFWAKLLYPFVTKHPGGIGLRDPHTMQIAIQEAGLARILAAGLISAFLKPLGFKGIFYKLAGSDVNAIDGPTPYSLPPGNKSATLGPKNPQMVARNISEKFNIKCAIVDANDYGVRIMGVSSGLKKAFLEEVLKDNPLGQAREQTPIALIRAV